MAAEAGRDLASVPVTIWGAKENLDLLKRDRDDGVSRLVVSLDSGKTDTILPELDRWAMLIRQLGGQASARKFPASIVKQPITGQPSVFSRRVFARVMHRLCPSGDRGRREDRMLAAPAASCAV